MRLIFALIFGLIAVSSAGPLYIVRDGRPVVTIVTPDDAPAVITTTVNDLMKIIYTMSGAQLPVVKKSEWTSGNSPALILDMKHDKSLEPLAYRVTRKGNRVIFTGGNDMGVVNGVYAYLSKELGCRWYMPGDIGSYIPKRATITVNLLNISDAPDFESSKGFGRSHDGVAGRLWLKRNRMLGFYDQGGGHNWDNILAPSVASEHPEYFALYNGTRNDQLCTTHPAVIDSTVAVAKRFFDKNPTRMFSLSPNDNERFCQCERCRALDHKLGADTISVQAGRYTPRLVVFMNAVAERVVKTHPDRYFTFYAYNSYTHPSKSVKIHPNIFPKICKSPWMHCVHHTLTDPKCKRNQPIVQSIIDWNATASRVFYREYLGHWAWFGPYAMFNSIKHDIPWLHKQGVDVFNSETHANWWTQGLNFTLATRLFWDVNADAEEIKREYYEHLYGPAAAHMTLYGNMFEDLMISQPYDDDDHLAFIKRITPEVLDRAGAFLKLAEHAVAEADIPESQRDIYKIRLRKFRAGYRFTRAQIASYKNSKSPVSTILGGGESLKNLIEEMEADSSLHDVVELGSARRITRKAEGSLQAYRHAWTRTVISDEERTKLKDALRMGRNREFANGIGCVTDWNVIGMFGCEPGKGMTTVCPPEQKIDFTAKYEGKYGPVRWVKYQNDNPFGIIDLKKYHAPQLSKDVITYLYTEVDYRHKTADGSYVRMYLGANDGMTIWQNGKLIYYCDSERKLTLDEDRITVRMLTGKNTFLVKVYNSGGGFGFSMRVLNWDFTPTKSTGEK